MDANQQRHHAAQYASLTLTRSRRFRWCRLHPWIHRQANLLFATPHHRGRASGTTSIVQLWLPPKSVRAKRKIGLATQPDLSFVFTAGSALQGEQPHRTVNVCPSGPCCSKLL